MNFKQIIFRAALLIGAAALLSLAGCGLPGAQSAGTATGRAATNYYQAWTAGSGTMNAQNLGNGHYTVSWSNIGDIVVGTGWNPCNSANIQWTGSAGNAAYFGVYGWLSSPLVEYYIGRGGGTSAGSYSTSKGSFTLNSYSCNGPNITGSGNFVQYNCSGNGSSPVNLAEHFQGWKNLGKQVTTQNYCIVATEAWGNSSGSADVTVSAASTPAKTWQTLGTGTNEDVYALVCNGSTLYVGGYFTAAGGKTAYRIAQYSGTTWSPVGSGTEFDATVNALAYNSSTSALFAGGIFTSPSPYFARYKSGSWGGYGGGTGGMDGAVNALAFTPGKLYVGGTFTNAGGVAVTNIAMWDGSKWNAVGSLGKTLPNGGFDPQVKALAVDSSGTLYAAWTYYVPSGHGAYTVSTVSKWSASAWSDIGTFNSGVGALACSGTTLYAGGGFTTVGSVTAYAIAKYSGGTWSALGSGIGGGWVKALACDSSGNLYVGGAFGTAGGLTANNIAEYTSGGSWVALGSGTNSAVNALAFDSSGNLYAGGWFTSPGNYIAVYK